MMLNVKEEKEGSCSKNIQQCKWYVNVATALFTEEQQAQPFPTNYSWGRQWEAQKRRGKIPISTCCLCCFAQVERVMEIVYPE